MKNGKTALQHTSEGALVESTIKHTAGSAPDERTIQHSAGSALDERTIQHSAGSALDERTIQPTSGSAPDQSVQMTTVRDRDDRDRDGNGRSSFFLPLVKRLERLAADCKTLGRIYTHLFYRRMIRIECDAARLPPGSNVIQVGCGHFPMTALALAKQGFRVTAVDRDPDTLQTAIANDASGKITFLEADALTLDYSGYNAVFVALHVSPRQAVLERVLETADSETQILLRNPRGSLNGSYTRVRTESSSLRGGGSVFKLPGQKELLVLRKPGAAGGCAICRLCDLSPDQRGEISHAPVPPQLAAMGFRLGKECTILAVQPWGGPVICSVAGRDVAVERTIAAEIEVTPRNHVQQRVD